MHIQTYFAVSEVMKDNTVTVKVTVLQHVTPCSFVRLVPIVCLEVDISTKIHVPTKLENFSPLPYYAVK